MTISETAPSNKKSFSASARCDFFWRLAILRNSLSPSAECWFSGSLFCRRVSFIFFSLNSLMDSRFCGFRCRRLLRKNKTPPNHHKDGRDKKQGADGGENQSAYHRSSQGSILLSTFS